MKRSLIIALALVTVVSSCDFIRTLAGRPTSEELEQMRLQRMAAAEARHQATLDSMERAQKHMADSLEALEKYLLDSLTQAKGTVLNPSKLGGLYTTKLETKYCYTENERDEAQKKIKNSETTRFKGLGEINWQEFKNFIGPDMKLSPVTLSKDDNIKALLDYFMGNNTQERQNFIIENLRMEED